ncbi:MAG: aromatic ring-hydroxylating oxygenase subunit alpha [Egibacteraceae bacterium]
MTTLFTPHAPLPATDVTESLRPFGESRMLPAAAYTADDVFAWERRHLLAGSWFCLGRWQDLWASGATQRSALVGDIGVLLTRADSHGLAFANTCRHRGHELLPAGGAAPRRSIVCPYHAWTYTLDGQLQAAPGFREVASFEPDEHGLVPLPLRVWRGWVFVNATGDASDFEEHVGAMASLLAPYRPETLVPLARHDYEVAANWKVVCENYHECYHCPLIHPELCAVSPPTSGDNYKSEGAWVGGTMELREGVETMSLDGRSDGRPIEGADQHTVAYLGLFPNLLVSAHPDYVMTHRLVPLAPGRTRIECAWYFPDSSVDPAYAVEFWDRTNRQDWAACESVQRGLASPHFRPGPLAPNEDAIYDFVSMVARGYRGEPLARADAH